MRKSSIIFGLVLGAFVFGMGASASAKSLYVITDLNTNPTPIKAYDVNPSTGLLTYQTKHTVTTYSGGGVDAAMDSDNGYLFIVYEFSPTVNIIYGKDMKQVGTVNMPGNSRTSGIVYDHKRKRLYASYRNSGRVYSYSWNHTTKKLTYIKYYALSGTSSTYGLDLDENKGLLYVGGYNSTVNYYDVTNNFAKKGSISVAYSNHRAVGVAVDATRRYLYSAGATSSGDQYLCQNNLDTGKLIKCVSGMVTRGISVDTDSGYVYTTTYTSKALVVYDSNLVKKQTFTSIGNPTGLIVPGKDISYNPLNLTIKNNNTTCNMPGSTVTYTISYENKNTYKVTNAILTSTLPSTLTYISSTGSGTHSGGKITWKLGTLNAGAKGSVTLTAKLSSSMSWNATFKNAAVLDTDQTPPTSQGDTSKVCANPCGNGKIDTGETCDTAITSGTGKCPTTCNDGKPCTTDSKTGTLCTAKCVNTVISAKINGDSCCPVGANSTNDTDCPVVCGNGVLEAGENCDTGITSGAGKCPTTAACNDQKVCTSDSVVGSACSAKCQNTAILANLTMADGCCPSGATQLTDVDCNPVCGNAAVETGEKCDTAIKSGPGKCPALADCNDLDVCTLDSLKGTSCTLECVNKTLVANMAAKDGCCPTGETTLTDIDCLAVCGNGLLEAGENCDTKITTGPGVCPTKADCDDKDVCTEDTVAGFGCAAKCDNKALKASLTMQDSCCPQGASSLTDVDCKASCGNGVLEAGETCDPKISSGAGVCPVKADCDDNDVCTKDSLTGGACTLKCDNTKLTANPTTADSCCPQGETSLTDIDCKAACGNGVLEAGEDCDTKITSGKGKCPATAADCDDQDKCTEDKVTGADCATKCDNTTLVKADLTAKDGCCPKGETHLTDKDCKDPCDGVECGPNQKCENGKCVGSGKDAGGDASEADAGAPDKGVAPGVDATSGADVGEDGTDSDTGCNCQTGGNGGLPGLLLIGLLLILARRRRS